MKRSEAAKIVALLMATFTHRVWSKENALAYEQAILDLDAAAAQRGVERLIHTKDFLPSVAEIRRSAVDEQLGPIRSGEEAWGIVMAAIRKHGGYEPTPKFRDPAILHALRLWGSWQDLCWSPENDPAGRARFIDLYETRAKFERENLVAGKALPPAGKGAPEFTSGLARPVPEAKRMTAEEIKAAMPKLEAK